MTWVNSVGSCCIEIVLLNYRLKHPHLLKLFLQLQRKTNVVLLNCFQNVQDKLIDFHFKAWVLIEKVGKR